ncbi:MAG: flavodoxin family protein [Candidatus Omnitrophica bacterium]|nr:flavodoxin family protein [Candidatus Omnitrophota bacterium]MBU1047492.1 flavodoxin family protein [Candidatus Omnitrophota bacterium]MBU1767750.1 flavodoxin family protein [Candidatus Omnitrophota bacterium]MBU1888855.1 flavodoxin family protein [Candidatus Omnitrophota bacterium]
MDNIKLKIKYKISKMKDRKLPLDIRRISGTKSSESLQDSRGKMRKQKAKRIIGILGSPRRGGNTKILLDKALEAARRKGAKTKKIILNELRFSPCQECENIRKDGVCTIKDDWQKIVSEIKKADGLILASPIFFGSVSAQTKMFIDRFQCLWLAKNVFQTYKAKKRKIGAFICVEASDRKDFFENAKAIVKNFFVTIDTDYKSELLCCGIDSKGAINKKPNCLKKAFEIGEKIAI